ncbi:hypothetical protein RCF13_23645, partial [Stenotrophomonas maltophilia group sp. RNC7]|nr:hypothetical protein [Stenotrophomonas maltophilia group sp. RNC7]
YFRRYCDLIADAERVLTGLRKSGLQPADKAILQFDSPEDFISAFWGCVIGGIVPVPVAPVRNYGERSNEAQILYSVWETLEKPCILTNTRMEQGVKDFSRLYEIDLAC